YQMVVNGVNDGYVVQNGVKKAFDAQFLLREILMPMVYIILSIVAGRFIWRLMFVGTAIKVEEQLRNRMFDHSRCLSQSYYQLHKVGGLMSLYTNDLDTVQECFSWGIMMFCDAVFLGVLALSKMFRMNHLLTFLSLIPTALLLASATVVGKHLTKKWDIRQEAFSRLSDFSQESFSGIAVIKAFVKEGRELWAFKKLNIENENANIAHTKASVLFRVMVTLFVESVICIILGYGGYLVYRGIFNAGQLVEFIGYFMAIVWPVMAVSDLIDMTSRGRASLKRISGLLDAEVEVVDRPGAKPLENIRGEIEFRDLSFRYPDGEFDVLEHVSFKINPGENVGLVGKTGSGKTTLVDLILRTYNVPDGTLFIDGHDVNDVTIHSIREGCAYVPQDNYLFSESIEKNIAFSQDEPDAETVERSARLSDVHDNIMEFQNGYKTVLGERGVTVSGGQKQRISIARSLLKDAPILILDYSVSAVDTGTEKTILENLRQTRKGKTTILIAHRVSTIRNMDKLLYLENGRIADIGTHDELYERCPGYRKMVDLQKLEEEGGHEHA
ncbi:MAG: ABC transporter ATP-binding protein, partial [Oscillospiraceae bacterium]|nr:ABC transporter ATP-binding protein [Oscillospiraceae bacterium]